MDNSTLVAAVDTEGRRLLAVADGSLDVPVTTCPDWDVAALLVHMGRVYTFIGGLLANVGSTEMPEVAPATPPEDREVLVSWVTALHSDLVKTLRETDPAAPAWNWAGTGQAAFFARRMAHETLVHRWDAEVAVGDPTPIDSDLGADGVDEVIEVGMRRSARPDHKFSYPEGSLHLHRTDGEGEWLLRSENGQLISTREHAKGDAAVRGTGDQLMLYIWGRGGENLEIFGDPEVAEAWTRVTP